MKLRTLALFALAALALAVAGCGGSDSSNSAAEATDTTTTEVTATDTTGVGESTTTEDTTMDETTSTDETSTESTGGIGNLSGECLKLATVGAKYSEAIQQASGAGNGDLSQSTKIFEEFAKAAPEEIRADLQLIAKSIGTYAEALKGLDLSSGKAPTAEQIAKLEEISKSFNSADLQKASEHIQAWVTKNCSKS